MTGPNDTLDDETYESLIEELGLDLDIDEPIGEHDDEQEHSSSTAPFETADTALADVDHSEQSDSGVEIPAELLAELQSVIEGGDPEFNEDATFVEDPLQASGPEGEDIDLASALMSDAAEEVEAIVPVESETEALLEELKGETAADATETDSVTEQIDGEEVSVFDGLDLSEEALSSEFSEDENSFDSTSLEETEDAYPEVAVESVNESQDIETSTDDDWVSSEPSNVDNPKFEDLDSILENALSKDFEPPIDDGQFSDRLSQIDELDEEVELEANNDVPFEAFEEPEVSPSSRTSTQRLPSELPSFDEDLNAPDGGFSLNDFADDTSNEVMGLAEAPEQTEAYVPQTSALEASYEDEADLGFEMSQSVGGDRIIPRITIHAFSQTQLCNQMLKKSMQDRRMVNVSAEIVEGGVEAAINYYQQHDLPHMIVVESIAKSARLLAELDELAQLCDENVKVVVIGAANDIRLYRELMARGVSEYIVPPLETVQLIRAISGQFADPDQPFVGKTLAVTGVKGGVGSSTIAHNLAWSLSERLDQGTTLVDLDLNFGTTGLDFNSENNQTIADALLAPERFDEAVMSRLITPATDNLSLFTAPASLDRTYDVDGDTYNLVLNKVRETVPFVVLDLPHIWTDWFKDTVISADEIVVVAQPDLASLRNGKNLIDFLKAARPNDSTPRLVVNQVGVPKRPEIPVKDFAQAMDLEPDLVLPFDPQLFGTAANNGQMIADVAEDSKCAQGIDYLASLISGKEVKVERSSLLNKLFKR